MVRSVLSFLALIAALQAHAGCPPSPDRSAEHAALFEALAATRSPAAAEEIVGRIWRFWTRAPDTRAQRLLDRGVQQIRTGDYAGAEATLDELVVYCPGFPEGWNQRAFARFLAGDLQGSLDDIEQVLKREPAHFGALSGQMQILLMQGRRLAARGVLREALKIHPWLAERELIGDPGEDI